MKKEEETKNQTPKHTTQQEKINKGLNKTLLVWCIFIYLCKLRILSCSFAPIAAFQRSSSINQVFFFCHNIANHLSNHRSKSIPNQNYFPTKFNTSYRNWRRMWWRIKKKSNVSLIMDFHTNLNFPLMNCFWMCQIVSLVVFIYLINISLVV